MAFAKGAGEGIFFGRSASMKGSAAQGAIEYLLIIGAAILVVAIVILAMVGVISGGQNQVGVSTDTQEFGMEGLIDVKDLANGISTIRTDVSEHETGINLSLVPVSGNALGAFSGAPAGTKVIINGVTYEKTANGWVPPNAPPFSGQVTVLLPAGAGGFQVVEKGTPFPPAPQEPAYAVEYNANGGTGGSVPVDSNSYLSGANVVVLGNAGSLVKTGYIFSGWNTRADGLGTDRAAGSTFSMGSADVNLYAKWIDAEFFGGSGTAEDPYQITKWVHLGNVRNHLGDNFILLADLNSGSAGYSGIGNAWTSPIGSSSSPFTGNFDGNGHTISNLATGWTDNPRDTYRGLFGNSSGNISKIGVSVNIVGSGFVGGLVGQQLGGTISRSYSVGSVNARYSTAGGLVGVKAGGTISDSYSTAAVSGYGSGVGGLVGRQNSGGIFNSYAAGSVNGNNGVGGLVGYMWGGDGASNSYATGATSGAMYVGGLVGWKSVGAIPNCGWWAGAAANAIGLPSTPAITYNEADKTVFYSIAHGVYSTWNFGVGGNWAAVAGNYPVLSWQIK